MLKWYWPWTQPQSDSKMNLNRSEDRAGFVGTIAFHILLVILFIILMMTKACTPEKIDPFDAGGVMVSLGEPDFGGPDQQAAEQEKSPSSTPETYTPQSQVTSDIEEAPEVQETKPQQNKPKPNNPTPKPSPTEPTPTPTETKEEPRKPNDRDLFGKNTSGGGSGTGTKPGQQGDPTGSPDGRPDGSGGRGTSGDGPDLGGGITGGIGGFSVTKVEQPRGGVQEEGLVRLKVCVDANGNVIGSTIKWDPNNDPNTTSNLALRQRAIEALKKFQFKNVSGSNGGCGHINFMFRLH